MGTICDKLEYLVETKQAIKDAIVSKGVALSDNDTFRSYPARIARIPEKDDKPLYGLTVKDIVGDIDANGQLVNNKREIDLNFEGVESIGEGALQQRFPSNTYSIKTVSMPHLKEITTPYACQTAFGNQQTLTHVDLSKLEKIQVSGSSGYSCASMFYYCTNATFDIGSLKIMSGYNACYQMFFKCQNADFDLSNIEVLSGTSCCSNAFNETGITYINMPKLTTLTDTQVCNSMFAYTQKAISADLSGLKSIYGQNTCQSMFNRSYIKSIDLSNLETIDGYYSCRAMFSYAGLEGDMYFPKLKTISGDSVCCYMFEYTNLKNIYFPSLTKLGTYTNQFNKMLSGVTGCTVHFPAALESVMGEWTDVKQGFGGINTTVLFDLDEENSGTTDDGSYTPR